MSFFGAPVASSGVNRVSTLTIQTSAYGVAIPRVWGTARVAGNLIWYGDFTSTAQSAGGGKGGASYVAGYTYSSSVQIGLCDNPITALLCSWENKTRMTFTAAPDQSAGSLGQSPWAYLSAKHPTEALAYPGLAWVGVANGNLGTTPTLPSLSYEVQTASSGAGGSYDASPAVVVQDILTDAGFPASRVGDLSAYTDFVFAYGLFLSPVLDQQQRAGDHLDKVFEMTCSAPFFSEGKLKVVPYGDTQKTGNGRTFTPIVAPSYALTDDDFLAIEGEALPIRIVRKSPGDQKNSLRLEFKDRALEYNTNTVEVQDDAHAAQFGRRANPETRTYEAIKSQSVAQSVAWLQMQRGLYVCNTYEFKLGLKFCRLEPMDILTLTHAGLGLSGAPVRVLDVEDSPDGKITVTAEDFVQGAGLAPTVPSPPSSGYSTNANVAPGNAAAPVVFEPPLQLAGQPEIWLATGGGANYGGCDVWVSFDGTTYKKIGTHAVKSRFGVTTAVFPTGVDPDTTSTLSVDLTASGGVLSGGLAQDRDTFNTLCWVGGELVSYQTSTLVSAGRYNLSSLRRGAYGSPISAHASGASFVRLDGNVFRYAYDPSLVGKTLYLKLQAFNLYGAAYQDLAALSPVAYTVQGYPPPNLSGYAVATAGDGTRVHTWSTSAAVVSGAVVEVRFSASAGAAWSAMSVLGQAPYGGGRLEVQTPAAGTWTFEARIRDTFGAISATGARTTVTLGAAPVGAVGGANRAFNTSAHPLYPNDDGWSVWTNAGSGFAGSEADRGYVLPAWATYAMPGGASRYLHAVGSVVVGRELEWNVHPQQIQVLPGTRVEAYALTGAMRCTAAVCINWYDGLGGLTQVTVGSNVSEKPGGTTLADFKKTGGFAVAPAGTRWMSLCVKLRDMTGADAYVFFDQAYIGEALDAQSGFSPWSDGARAVTNTSQLTDGASLGQTAKWSGVTGAGRPQDNATAGATLGVNVDGQITASNVAALVGAGAMGTSQLAAQAATSVMQSASATYSGILSGSTTAIGFFDLLDEAKTGAVVAMESCGMFWPQGAMDVYCTITAVPGTPSGPGLGLPWGTEYVLVSEFPIAKFSGVDERGYSIGTSFVLPAVQNIRVFVKLRPAGALLNVKQATRIEVMKR